QTGLQLVDIVHRFEAVTQHQRAAQARHLDLVRRVPPLVVALDDRDFDAEQPPLPGLAVEKAHGRQWSVVSSQWSVATSASFLPRTTDHGPRTVVNNGRAPI